MSLTGEQSIDYPSWAQRANARWMVHGGLGQCADAYMAHLGQNHPKRLVHSCHNAYLMVWQRDCREDPKIYFYSGLFSLATFEEVERFLAGEPLAGIMPILRAECFSGDHLHGTLGDYALDTIESLRAALAKLPDFPE